jgi:hypothetical protein
MTQSWGWSRVKGGVIQPKRVSPSMGTDKRPRISSRLIEFVFGKAVAEILALFVFRELWRIIWMAVLFGSLPESGAVRWKSNAILVHDNVDCGRLPIRAIRIEAGTRVTARLFQTKPACTEQCQTRGLNPNDLSEFSDVICEATVLTFGLVGWIELHRVAGRELSLASGNPNACQSDLPEGLIFRLA